MAGVGIYLNTANSQVARVSAPPLVPQGSEWKKVTDETNASLLTIRNIIRRENLVADPDSVTWQ